MASIKQMNANRRNAEKSTGPATPEGKQAASRNSVRHGLTALSPMVLAEEQEDYEQFVEAMRYNHQPQGALEYFLVDRMIHCAWGLRRVSAIEASLLVELPQNGRSEAGEKNLCLAGKKNDGPGALGRAYTRSAAQLAQLSRHERQLDRSFDENHRKLEKVQYARIMDYSFFYVDNIAKFPPPDNGRAKKEEGHYRSGTPEPLELYNGLTDEPPLANIFRGKS